MRQSRDRILTSHAGSLPRPDELIEANQAREAGTQHGRAGLPGDAHVGRRRRRTAPAGRGHRRAGRRRVRQVDGTSRELPGVVELLVPASGRPRAGHAGSLRHPAEPIASRSRRAHELRRPPRSPAIRRGVRRPRLRHHDRAPRAALWPVCVGPLTYTGSRRDPGRHRQPQGGARRGRRRGGLHDLHRAGQRLPHREPPLQDRRGVPLRVRRRHARRSTRPSSTPGSSCSSTIRRSPRTGTWSIPSPRSKDYRKFSMVRVEALNHAIRGLPAGPDPLSPLLGKLARASHDRRPDARHRRRHAGHQGARLLVRGRQRPPRARVEGVAGRRSCRPTR